jgi:hypothetical protein
MLANRLITQSSQDFLDPGNYCLSSTLGDQSLMTSLQRLTVEIALVYPDEEDEEGAARCSIEVQSCAMPELG